MTLPARSMTHEDTAILVAFYKRQGHRLGTVSFSKLRAFDDQTPLHARKSTGKAWPHHYVEISFREYVTATSYCHPITPY
jgi:hypothetical protein